MKNNIHPGFIFGIDENVKKTLTHLFKREFTEEEIKEAGELLHLTTSDAERGQKLSREFGRIKCEECKKVADSYGIK